MPMKKLRIVTLIIVLLFLEVGCMNTTDNNQILAEQALAYICEKYDREFTPIFYENPDYLSSSKTIECITEGLDPEHERVDLQILYDDNGAPYFVDNYFGYLVRPEMEAYIGDIIATEFAEYKVFREGNNVPKEGLEPNDTLEDVYKIKPTYRMTMKVYVNGDPNMTQEEYQAKAQRIEQILLESGHRYTMYIFAVSNEVYRSIDRYTQGEFWKFFAQNDSPDGEKYYYVYNKMIKDGEVQ